MTQYWLMRQYQVCSGGQIDSWVNTVLVPRVQRSFRAPGANTIWNGPLPAGFETIIHVSQHHFALHNSILSRTNITDCHGGSEQGDILGHVSCERILLVLIRACAAVPQETCHLYLFQCWSTAALKKSLVYIKCTFWSRTIMMYLFSFSLMVEIRVQNYHDGVVVI